MNNIVRNKIFITLFIKLLLEFHYLKKNFVEMSICYLDTVV